MWAGGRPIRVIPGRETWPFLVARVSLRTGPSNDIAIREAEEETGLELAGLPCRSGALELLQTFSTATRPPLFVRPVLYILPGPPPPFNLNGELDDAFWIPFSHLGDPTNATTLQYGNPPRTFPGIQFGDDVIWGFTLRMLGLFGEAIS